MVLENGVYAYFLTPTAPFVPPCLMGEVAPDAFGDGGPLDGAVDICPFEGTNPLAGTEICNKKTIVFQDETCPGNADRQDIRYCFELSTNSFVGEPTCDEFEFAVSQSLSCFTNAGCCLDLEVTIQEWQSMYPSLQECVIPDTGCLPFGRDNVLSIRMNLGVPVTDLVPDTRALLRQTMASTVAIEPSQVQIDSVSGSNTTSVVVFLVAFSDRAQAAAALEALDETDIIARFSSDTGFPVDSLESQHLVPPTIPETWSTRNKAGIGASVAAIVVLLGLLIFFEEKGSTDHASEEEKKDLKDDQAKV
jgi:hypothetical protein